MRQTPSFIGVSSVIGSVSHRYRQSPAPPVVRCVVRTHMSQPDLGRFAFSIFSAGWYPSYGAADGHSGVWDVDRITMHIFEQVCQKT